MSGVVAMLDARSLYELEPGLERLERFERPVLVHALTGFVDAGGGSGLAAQHLLETLEHRVVARFDVDQLLDYRSRRPAMTFVEDHWTEYDAPLLAVHELRDPAGTPFLLLSGPEPDLQWDRFTDAVRLLVEELDVRLTVGLAAIPMAVPHTRPIGVTAHGTRRELLAGYEPWLQTVQVPASAGNLLEFRLGQAGHDAMGFAVHVPHYVAQSAFPQAAEVLLDALGRATGLVLPTRELHAAAATVTAAIGEQVAKSEEVSAAVRALEQQYDAFVGTRGRRDLLVDERTALPTADELGAELERFLAEQAGPDDRPPA